jgi:hypothetical protein
VIVDAVSKATGTSLISGNTRLDVIYTLIDCSYHQTSSIRARSAQKMRSSVALEIDGQCRNLLSRCRDRHDQPRNHHRIPPKVPTRIHFGRRPRPPLPRARCSGPRGQRAIWGTNRQRGWRARSLLCLCETEPRCSCSRCLDVIPSRLRHLVGRWRTHGMASCPRAIPEPTRIDCQCRQPIIFFRSPARRHGPSKV